ncbi:hypothetical protein N2152v2_010237 [Parachlorella kessleri]
MSKLSQTSSSDGDFSADRLGRIKVLVVMKYPQDRAKQFPNLAGQEFFLELWDVGAQPRYEALRGLFYQGVNGVMLVHDLCQSRQVLWHGTLPSLQNWAAEVSQLGSFQAPYSEDRAALNLGGLPVPCLVVGNKQDLVGKHRCRHSPPRREQMLAVLQKPASRLWGCLAAALRRGSSPASSEVAHARSGSFGLNSLPKETLLHGNLQASALRGDLDMHAVTSFFCTLIERRYCPSFQCLTEDCLAGTACLAGADGAGALSPIVTRLSAERLPPVMYNAISEESSPYSSINHTPFSSCSSLNHAGGSGNWGSWLQTVPERAQSLHSAPSWQHPEQQAQQEQRAGVAQQPAGAPRAPSPLGFSGVNVALRLQGSGAVDQAQVAAKGKLGVEGLGPEGGWLGKLEAAAPVVFETA